MKQICITEELKANMLREFTKYLNDLKAEDGRVIFNAPLAKIDLPKPTLFVTASAYLKMNALVAASTDEIAWHGTVTKLNDSQFLIEEILVYPQTVTGANVNTDDAEMGDWFMKLPDETFNKLRFQGHSHVNMGTTPSAVDKNYYSTMLNSLRKDDFYIFMILNKRNEFFLEIYDLAKNVLYEKEDIMFTVVTEDGEIIQNWCNDEIKDKVKKQTTTTTTTTTSTGNTAAKNDITPVATYNDTRDLDWTIRDQMGHVWNKRSKIFVVPPHSYFNGTSGRYQSYYFEDEQAYRHSESYANPTNAQTQKQLRFESDYRDMPEPAHRGPGRPPRENKNKGGKR